MGDIKWTLVESSNIAAIGYDEERNELHVQFNSGDQYRYSKVPPVIFEGFKDSDSKGSYLNEYIKGCYAFQKIEQAALDIEDYP